MGKSRTGLFWGFPRVDDVRRGSRTFTVYQDFCSISVRPHQYGLIVYLLFRQAGLQVDYFQELTDVLVESGDGLEGGARKTHSIGDAVGEAHELDVVARTFPMGVQGQD